MKRSNTFYSIYLNVLSILLCSFCIIITLGRDKNMFFVSIVLMVLVLVELISNIIHYVKINKKPIDKN